MNIKSGKNQEEFLKILTELDQSTNIDCILKTKQRFCVTGVRNNGKIQDWAVGISLEKYNCSKPNAKGKTFNSFLDALENMDEIVTWEPDCSVLCYCDTDLNRSWDGKIISYWYLLDSGVPYVVKDHQPVFKIIKLVLDESDYKVMMQTKIAFYSETTEDVYPILETAFPSVGKLLDSVMSFKGLDEHPLGSALLLADKLSGMKDVRFLYRQRSENVKPIMCMMGRKYEYCPQIEFFQEALNEIAKNAIYDISKWSISDELTTLEVIIQHPNTEYQLGFLMKTSDLAGAALSIVAFAKIGRGYIELKKNKSYHSREYVKSGKAASLFDGLWDAFDYFDSVYSELENRKCKYDEIFMRPILLLLGKKRSKLVEPVEEGIYNAKDLFKSIISRTAQPLPVKQAGVLRELYKQLMDHIYKTSYKEVDKMTV